MSYPGANYQQNQQQNYGQNYGQDYGQNYGAPNQGYQPQQQGYQSGYQQGYPPPQQQPYQQQHVPERPGAGGYNPNVNSFGAPQGPPPNWDNRPHYQGPTNPQIVQDQRFSGNGPAAPPMGQQDFGANNMHFQYGNLQGKKKALLIGINYFRSNNELKGCINDVHNMVQFLTERYGFSKDDMVILTDDQTMPRAIPTRQNIISAMQWLVAGAQPNDNLFLHYSGHGGKTKDLDGDEDDGYDECIYPVDFQQTQPGHLVDDIIHDICVKSLPPGCRLTAVFDCCHSGSIMDLPYMYSTKGVLKEPNLLKDAGQGLLGLGSAYMRNDIGGLMSGASGLFSKITQSGGGNQEMVKQMKTAPADVICFTGCKDDQTSADASIAGQGQGAMSFAFRNALLKNPQQSYLQLLNSVRQEMLQGRYQQKPQLSCCHPLDCNLLFTL